MQMWPNHRNEPSSNDNGGLKDFHVSYRDRAMAASRCLKHQDCVCVLMSVVVFELFVQHLFCVRLLKHP